MFQIKRLIAIIILTFHLHLSSSINLQDELLVTYDQKLAIEKLRQRVAPILTTVYMKGDLYLVRWLRVTDFKVARAEQRIREDLKWRQQNKIENILQEDFTDMETQFSLSYSVDKQGQPVMLGFAGDWDLRAATVTGQIPRLSRYLIQGVEKVAHFLHHQQQIGQNATRFDLITNLEGFNVRQHGCPACVYRIIEFLLMYDDHYPGLADRAVFVNTPVAFAAVSQLISMNIHSDNWRVYKFYGKDKTVWQKALLEFIAKENLPERLGGTMTPEEGKNLI